MLDADLKTQLREHFAKIAQPVEITAALDDGDKSRELRELLSEIAALSPQFRLVERVDEGMRVPSFALDRPGSNFGIRFSGMPMGHEFTSLILALLQVGGHPSKLTDETIEQVRTLPGEYRFETFVS